MGSFRSLADVGTTRHLMMSSSSMASIFAHDTLRRVHNTTIDCVYTVNSRKEYKIKESKKNVYDKTSCYV